MKEKINSGADEWYATALKEVEDWACLLAGLVDDPPAKDDAKCEDTLDTAATDESTPPDKDLQSKDNESHNTFPGRGRRVEKAVVLQDSRVFHDTPTVKENPQHICQILTSLLQLQNDPEIKFTRKEATELFFGATKLLVSEDAFLRRLVYLWLKEIQVRCDPNDVIIITSSMTKDLTSTIRIHRAQALLILCRIIDSAMLSTIERYIKQAMIDSYAPLASAAIVTGILLFDKSFETQAIIRKWVTETHQSIQRHKRTIVEFHGICLLYLMKAKDRIGLSKMIDKYTKKGALRVPLALVTLIRVATHTMTEELKGGYGDASIADVSPLCRKGLQFFRRCLKHPTAMVTFEAAAAICSLPHAAPEELAPAVNVLNKFLLSQKTVDRFVAARTLCHVATKHPRLVACANPNLEILVDDENSGVATYAIRALLKTGTEAKIARLLRYVTKLMAGMDDDCRIEIIQSLCATGIIYPTKHLSVVNFLANFLESREGSFEFKHAILSALVDMMRADPSNNEYTLDLLGDCLSGTHVYIRLTSEILSVIAELGKACHSPGRYILPIYNSYILGQAPVRASAVSALGKFGAFCPDQRISILVLLEKCCLDDNEEVRDRATLARSIIADAVEKSGSGAEEKITNGYTSDSTAENELDDVASCAMSPLPMSFDSLSKSLEYFKETQLQSGDYEEPLSFDALPVIRTQCEDDNTHASDPIKVLGANRENPAEAVYAIPELAAFGQVLRSSKRLALTEAETEYVVQCTKHILEDYIILQFSILNTVEDQKLEKVRVAVDLLDDSCDVEVVAEMDADSVPYGETADCFTILRRIHLSNLPIVFSCDMNFTCVVVDLESDDGDEIESYEEEYQLENLDISFSDFLSKKAAPNFRKLWNDLGESGYESNGSYELQYESISEALPGVIGAIGMQPCDGTGRASSPGVRSHMLHLSAMFDRDSHILARAKLVQQNKLVIMKLLVRSKTKEAAKLVVESL